MITPSRFRLSYRDRRSYQKQRFRGFRTILVLFIFYELITLFGVVPFRIQSVSLEPNHPPGSRVLVHPFLFRRSDGSLRVPPSRGDLVLVHLPYVKEESWPRKMINTVLRFVTLQRFSLESSGKQSWEKALGFKRVIAVPGDTLRLEESVAYVKTSDQEFFLSEFETGDGNYDITVSPLPEGWGAALPLSGNRPALTLGPGEYYVLGDNRSSSNDSRYWGPLSERNLRGRVVFTYWPLHRFGFPR